MTPERYQRIGELFHEALELSPEQRESWLDQTCGSDSELRVEVANLLANEVESNAFLSRPALNVAAEILAGDLRPSLVGKTIGRYQIISQLGSGGMGEVYLAQDTRLGRSVALKVLAPQLREQQEQLRRLEQEARAASALNHPNILTIYETGEADNVHFIAAEYVGGESLRECLGRGTFTVRQALEIAIQIVAALEAAHRAGIVHRDVKPENIILRKDGLIKLLDFGIAKLAQTPIEPLDDDAQTQQLMRTSPGVVVGTASYMSPEQVRGQTVDPRTDEWSFGVTLYEMLTGVLPFAGETLSDKIAEILKTEPEPPTQLNPEIPSELQRIILKTLRKDPEERYQNIKSLLIDLRDLMQTLEVQSKLQRTRTHDGLDLSSVSSKMPGGQMQSLNTAASLVEPSKVVQFLTAIKQHNRGILLGLTISVIVGFAALNFGYPRAFNGTNTAAIDSVAVMPFVDQNGNASNEYMQDGLTESLIISLSRLPQLRVMARATMFRYKGRVVDPQTVGKEVGVQAVLAGTVVQQGDSLTIDAELVNVADGARLWGERYSRRSDDLLATQQEIAREISEHLRLRLSGEQEQQLYKGSTIDNEAFQLYLRGRYSWNKRTAEEIKKAIDLFQQAINRDPKYALAYVGLADCYIIEGAFAGTPTTDVMPQAAAAVEQALRLDNSIAEAHASKGFIHIYSLEWDEAEREFQRAISLNPNYATAHHWYSEYFRIRRQFPEQAREIKRAQELDPLSPSMGANLGRSYLNLGDTESAIRECKRALELNPTFPLAHHFLGLTYVEQGRYDDAISEFKQAVDSSKRADLFVAGLGIGYAMAGKRAEALQLVRELEQKYAKREATGFDLALVHSALGNNDAAIGWLQKDFAQRNMSGLIYVASTIIHPRLQNDPRYRELLQRLHLKE